ncbi:MAG: penicillin-binding protein [Terriglobales bacterium]
MRQARHQPASHRLAGLALLLVVWALVVLGRLYWLQVREHGWLAARARAQQQHTVELTSLRGTVYDRNLTPLAMTLPVESLYADPHQVADAAREAARLAPVVGVAEPVLARRLGSDHSFVWVARQLNANAFKLAEALQLPGIYSQPAARRFYPNGELAASVLGYVGLDGHGLAGIEYSLDSALHGRAGRAREEVDGRRKSYHQVEQPPQEGRDVVLTLDENIQYIAQQALDQEVTASHARSGVAVVEDPRTGEILALVNSPTFNPDRYQQAPAAERDDAAVSDPYEPGSVFKLVTVSAALQQGLVTPDEIIDCQMGSIRVGGRLIHDHAPFGKITVTEIIQHSSDVGAIKIGLKLGDQELYHYIRAYGFGARTGLRLPGESRGIVRPPAQWTPMSIGAVSMGQEVAVTPVQVVSLISTLADGGIYHAPRIVLGEMSGSAPEAPPAPALEPGRRVVSATVANEMKQMMAEVVLAGTAQQARLNGYTAAGKTGTAQMVDPGTHRYSTRDYVASFGGFAPINDPAVAILVVLNSPRGGHEGGQVAGPVFKAIAEQVLPYLGVPHDVPVDTSPSPRYIAGAGPSAAPPPSPCPKGTSPACASSWGPDLPQPGARATVGAVNPTATPAMPAASAGPDAAAAVPAGSVVLDYGRSIAVPDFRGQSLRQVAATCARLGLEVSLQGDGVARSQVPAPGSRLGPGGRVTVQFQPGTP